MATTTNKRASAAAEEAAMAASETGTAPAKAKETESDYTVAELAGAAKKIFGTSADCVTAALKSANIERCTVSKAQGIVNAFIKKEVK